MPPSSRASQQQSIRVPRSRRRRRPPPACYSPLNCSAATSPCHLIDARPAPLHWDRATVIHPRSLQIFESLGLVDQFLAAGCKQRIIKIHSRGKSARMMDLANCGSIYGFNLGLSEEVTESILTSYLHQHGGAVNRSSRLTALKPHANGAHAEIERDGTTYSVEAGLGRPAATASTAPLANSLASNLKATRNRESLGRLRH